MREVLFDLLHLVIWAGGTAAIGLTAGAVFGAGPVSYLIFVAGWIACAYLAGFACFAIERRLAPRP